MDIINPNIYLPSYDESQTSQTSQKKKPGKSKNDKPPKYSPSYIIQDNIIHPYIMQQPTNTVTIHVRDPIVLSNGIIFNYTSTIRNQNRNQGRNQRSHRKICDCYSQESVDSRCCGLCYHLCSAPVDDQCQICPVDLDEYINSGYCKTTDLPNSPDDCVCTTICCPLKISLFMPCLLGSILNGYLNCFCSTNKNYLF